MKTLRIVIGVLLLLAGGVWFLQGINLLPGSFMTGDPTWAIIGTITAIVGIAFLFWPRRGSAEE